MFFIRGFANQLERCVFFFFLNIEVDMGIHIHMKSILLLNAPWMVKLPRIHSRRGFRERRIEEVRKTVVLRWRSRYACYGGCYATILNHGLSWANLTEMLHFWSLAHALLLFGFKSSVAVNTIRCWIRSGFETILIGFRLGCDIDSTQARLVFIPISICFRLQIIVNFMKVWNWPIRMCKIHKTLGLREIKTAENLMKQ